MQTSRNHINPLCSIRNQWKQRNLTTYEILGSAGLLLNPNIQSIVNAPTAKRTKKAVILLSGGLDSTTTLAAARDLGYLCHAISFEYGQRCHWELRAARHVAQAENVQNHVIMPIDLALFGGSALTDTCIAVPKNEIAQPETIPITYVPARNTIFLSIALAFAETIDAFDIFIGANAVDYSGYPDCRPDYLAAFERLANLATKAGRVRNAFHIHAPLINLTKAEIIQYGTRLGVDYALTHSCYDPDESTGIACGQCESCRLRRKGFLEANVPDPTRYANPGMIDPNGK